MNITSLLAQVYTSPSYYDSYYESSYVTPAESAAAAGFFFFIFGVVFFIAIITYVVMALLLSRIFKKAGIEGWKAWVPIYNSWTLLEMGGQPGFWAVLMLVPVINIASVVFSIIAMYNIGLKFGKEGAFVLLAIFVPIVWYIWLAVDDSEWKGAMPKKAAPASK